MAKLLFFVFIKLVSFFPCIFSLLSLNLSFVTQGRPRRLKFFFRLEEGGAHWGVVSILGQPRVLFGYSWTYRNIIVILPISCCMTCGSLYFFRK